MTDQPHRTERHAARVLLLDERDRVLLFEGVDPHVPDAPFWFTPGGGVEADESHEVAARRELAEETGLTTAELGPVVWTRVGEFDFLGESYRQHERFFLARVPAWEVDTVGFNEVEQRSVRGHRWWSVAELRAESPVVFPTSLADRLGDLLRDGPPADPVDVGH